MKYPPLWIAEKITQSRLGNWLARHALRRHRCYEMMESIITALAVFVLLQAFVVQAYEIPSGSMRQTLLEGDRILVSKFVYEFEEPEYGDIVVFRVPDKVLAEDPSKRYYIKRLIGKPGDTLEIRDGDVWVNGERLDARSFIIENHYFNWCGGRKFTKIVVPEGYYYVFGDNSDISKDSRDWGGVPKDNLIGKAVFRFWPLTRVGLIGDRTDTYIDNPYDRNLRYPRHFTVPRRERR